jgi:hypothetical protein
LHIYICIHLLNNDKYFIYKFCLFEPVEEVRATIKLKQQHWELGGSRSASCMNTGVWCKYRLGRPLSCEGVWDECQMVGMVLQLLDKLLVPFEGVWDKC